MCCFFRFGETSDSGVTRHEGRGSEGFLEHIFKHAAKELFGLDVQEIVYKTLRWEIDQSVFDMWWMICVIIIYKLCQPPTDNPYIAICVNTCLIPDRNRDFQEVVLERDGETLLQFAAVYGFRNIQTLVHRMRKGKVPYQLVEVLSCPGGMKYFLKQTYYKYYNLILL